MHPQRGDAHPDAAAIAVAETTLRMVTASSNITERGRTERTTLRMAVYEMMTRMNISASADVAAQRS